MNTFSRVLFINVLVVLAYSVGMPALFVLTGGNTQDALGAGMALSVFALIAHIVIAFLSGLVLLIVGKKEVGLGMMVSAFAVFGVGLASCFGLIFFQEALSR